MTVFVTFHSNSDVQQFIVAVMSLFSSISPTDNAARLPKSLSNAAEVDYLQAPVVSSNASQVPTPHPSLLKLIHTIQG